MDRSQQDLAAIFKALGDPTRLRIFEFLRACYCPITIGEGTEGRHTTGRSVGEICYHLYGEDRIISTVSFHLKELKHAGLIEMERSGKHLIYSLSSPVLDLMSVYFAQQSERDSYAHNTRA